MPDKGHRLYGTTTVRVSLVINAPSRYVYDWCTDYRSDDGRFSSARPRPSFRVIRISPNRVLRIRASRGSGRNPRIAVDLVRLNPPRSWHLDQIDETDRQAVDYRVSAVGPLRPPVRGGFDTLGAVLLSGCVGALMVALVEVSDAGMSWTNPGIVALLVGAAVLFPAFIWRERRTSEPLVPLGLLRQRIIAASSGVMFFTGIVFSSLLTFLSVFVGVVLLQSGPNAAGDVRDIIYFLAIPLILGAGLAGQILTRVAYRNVIVPGLAVAAVSGLFLTQLTSSSPLWVLAGGVMPVGGIALPLIPMGFGLGFSLSVPTVAVQNESPRDEVGAAIGLTRFLQSLGGALGISLLSVFEASRLQALSQGATTPTTVTNAMVTTYDEIFLILAVCVMVAFGFALLFTGRVRQAAADKPEPSAPVIDTPPIPS